MTAMNDPVSPANPAFAEEALPPRPEPGDCCNGGCAVCVLEGYEEEVQAWERECAEILQRRAERKLREKSTGPCGTSAPEA